MKYACDQINQIIRRTERFQPVPGMPQLWSAGETVINSNQQLPLLTATDFLYPQGERRTNELISLYYDFFNSIGLFPSSEQAHRFPILNNIPLVMDNFTQSYKQQDISGATLSSTLANFISNRVLVADGSSWFPDTYQTLFNSIEQVIQLHAHHAKPKTRDTIQLKIDGVVFTVDNTIDLGNTEMAINEILAAPINNESLKTFYLKAIQAVAGKSGRFMINIRGISPRSFDCSRSFSSQITQVIDHELGGGHQYCVVVDFKQQRLTFINDTQSEENSGAYFHQIKDLFKNLGLPLDGFSTETMMGYSRPDKSDIECGQSCCISQFLHWCAIECNAPRPRGYSIEPTIPAQTFALLYALKTYKETTNEDLHDFLHKTLSQLKKNYPADNRSLLMPNASTPLLCSDNSNVSEMSRVKKKRPSFFNFWLLCHKDDALSDDETSALLPDSPDLSNTQDPGEGKQSGGSEPRSLVRPKPKTVTQYDIPTDLLESIQDWLVPHSARDHGGITTLTFHEPVDLDGITDIIKLADSTHSRFSPY